MTIKELSEEYYHQYEILEQRVRELKEQEAQRSFTDYNQLRKQLFVTQQMAKECLETCCHLLRHQCRPV